MEKANHQQTMDNAIAFALCQKLWDEYTDELADGHSNEDETFTAFCRLYNVPATSKLALMFHAFCGGLGKGLELAELIEKAAPAEE